MVGWSTQGSNLHSTMRMPEARAFKMANGQYANCPLGFVVQSDPGFILWLRTNGYGRAKEAAVVLGPMAEKVAKQLTELAENPLGDYTMDDMPF